MSPEYGSIPPENVLEERRGLFSKLALWSLIAGIAGMVLAVLIGFGRPGSFFIGYLFGFVFWVGLALGCGGVFMLHDVAGGRWGWGLRPALGSALRTLPLLAVFFIPIAFGLGQLYPWASDWTGTQAVRPGPELIRHLRQYLNVPFFLIRTAIVFALWITGGILLTRPRPHRTGIDDRRVRVSAPGFIIWTLTASVAAMDWIGSFVPGWTSSIFGLYFIMTQGIAGLTFVILVLAWIERRAIGTPVLTERVWHDLGNLLMTFVILHAYMAFSQWLLMWTENLPHEISWYVPRVWGFWGWMAVFVIVLHFGLPLFLLLFQANKQDPRRLSIIAAIVLAAQIVDTGWIVLPSVPAGASLTAISAVVALLAFIGLGGLWLALFFRLWRRMPPVPAGVPGVIP